MNNQIIDNLFQFWRHVGMLTNKHKDHSKFETVLMADSDWPNRVFNLNYSEELIDEIYQLQKESKVPNIICLEKPDSLQNNSNFQFVFGQKNMAMPLSQYEVNQSDFPGIKQLETSEDAQEFAQTASSAFGYRVDPNVINCILQNSNSTKLYIFHENGKSLACGIIFFDNNQNAGLHMIGTLVEGRGKGIGKAMTEKLLMEAKLSKSKNVVLHASLMGENIYRKLGFEPFGELETYRVV